MFSSLIAGLCVTALLLGPTDEQDVKQRIEKLLTSQDAAWNAGDIEGFMETYWKSEKLTFSGGGSTTRGWQATLDRYKKSYPAGGMGKLHFDGLETTLLSDEVALVLGNWHLDMDGKKRDGNFSLVMKKLDGHWKIVHDHSSTLEKEKGWMTVDQAKNVASSHFSKTVEMEFDVADQLLVAKAEGKRVTVDRKLGTVTSKAAGQ